EMLLDVGHGLLDVGDLTQLVGGRVSALQLTFYIIRQGGVVALDAGRAEALQNVEYILELEEEAWRGRPAESEAAEVFQLGQYVDKRRIEGRIKQRQIVVSEGRHILTYLNPE